MLSDSSLYSAKSKALSSEVCLSKASFSPPPPHTPPRSLSVSYTLLCCQQGGKKLVRGVLHNGTGGLDGERHMCESMILLGDKRAQ